MVLSSNEIHKLLEQLVDPADHDLVNPASLDIRIGNNGLDENGQSFKITDKLYPLLFYPGHFWLVETYETLTIPSNLCCELKLKSSIARQGFNHSLAFWFDPGWIGKGTMEVQNITNKPLKLYSGMRFAQLIFHELSSVPDKLYSGRYQGATGVEGAKPELS